MIHEVSISFIENQSNPTKAHLDTHIQSENREKDTIKYIANSHEKPILLTALAWYK